MRAKAFGLACRPTGTDDAVDRVDPFGQPLFKFTLGSLHHRILCLDLTLTTKLVTTGNVARIRPRAQSLRGCLVYKHSRIALPSPSLHLICSNTDSSCDTLLALSACTLRVKTVSTARFGLFCVSETLHAVPSSLMRVFPTLIAVIPAVGGGEY